MQIVACAEKNNHWLEKFQDLFAQGTVWVVQTMWRERLLLIEMMVFQESLIARGLKEFPDEEDQMLMECLVLVGYSAVLAAECLEAIEEVSERVIHNDCLV